MRTSYINVRNIILLTTCLGFAEIGTAQTNSGSYTSSPEYKEFAAKLCTSTKYIKQNSRNNKKRVQKNYGSQEIADLFLQARKKMSIGEYDQSQTLLNQAIANNDLSKIGRVKLFYAKGYVFYKAGDSKSSIEAYSNALTSGGANKWETVKLTKDIESLNENQTLYKSNAPQAIEKPAPSIPPRAGTSMSCRMSYKVNKKGIAEDIKAIYCTNRLFKKPSIDALKKWKFPKFNGIEDKSNVAFTRFNFTLKDDCGNIIHAQ